MEKLNLKDLHTPNNIQSIYIAYKGQLTGQWIEKSDNQAFQELPKSTELWQMIDGRLVRVQRWLNKVIVAST